MQRLLVMVVLLTVAAGSAHAATAMLTGPATVSLGTSFTLTLIVDLQADQSLGGGFDLTWDDGLLSFVGSTVTAPGSDPFFTRPGDPGPGLLTGLAFGSFNGYSGIVEVATPAFEVVASGLPSVAIGPNSVPAGPLVDFSGIPLDVVYEGWQASVIPLPAAAWLMLAGLGVLPGFRRKG